MAIDTNIPMMGKGIDTANPLQQLGATLRQSALDKSALAANALDLQSKQNIYATQVLSAAAGTGDQNTWAATKQHLAQNGIDVSGIPDDIKTGQAWADSARLAQSPLGSLLGAATRMDQADATAAGVNGTTVTPGAHVNALMRMGGMGAAAQPTPQMDGPAASTAQLQPLSQSTGQTAALQNDQPMPQASGGTQAGSALPADTSNSTPEQDQATRQKMVMDLHNQMDPRDQSRIRSVTLAAAQVKPMLDSGDVQGALKFAQDRMRSLHNRMNNGENVDDQDTAGFINLLQSGQVDAAKQMVNAMVMTGQHIGVLPADPQAPAQQSGGFVPSQGPANENPAAKEKRIANELAIYKMNIENDPAHAAAMKNADASGSETGKNVADVAKTLNVMQANLPFAIQRFQAMRDAADKASYGMAVNNEGTGYKQEFANQFSPDTATANNLLEQRAAQGILPELGPQLAQAGVRGNKFLESIASSASGLNLSAPPAAKKELIDGLEKTYINNLKATAAQARALGQQALTDDQIDQAVEHYRNNDASASHATVAPQGIDPKIWVHMTPEEQKLFQ